MYCSGVNPIKAFLKRPNFARHFFINSAIRVLYFRLTGKKLRFSRYAGVRVHDIEYSNSLLRQSIQKHAPYMAARYGSAELFIVTEALLNRYGLKKCMNMKAIRTACLHNGLFPVTEEIAMRFADITLESSGQLDLVGTFRTILEDYYIKYYAPKSVDLTHRHVFDFWLSGGPFTAALRDKKVLVIHPFEESIRQQYAVREKLFENQNVLPEFELKTLKAVQSIAGENCGFSTWFEALEYMYSEAMGMAFDVALLGCGAYGFPLAAMLKKAGKTAIHMGGVTQMLFGIKGRRWDEDPVASRLYNQYWIRPNKDEVPKRNEEVENGCYW